ncbi:MAG: hypothetical protein ABW252_12980 [Polyangiales bacterium]
MAKHIVLVPGFAGFDALGGLRYYAGVTEEFRRVRRADARLHYFDNFPTASVAQRAARLRKFLAKLCVRGVLALGDELTLVGHSTGGLDIRRLLRDLREGDAEQPGPLATFVDGCSEPVKASLLRGLIRRVVFVSVPHFGTNIGDYFHKLRTPIQAAAASAAEAVRRNEALPRFISELSASALASSRCELLDAIADTLRETDERASVLQRADEREARFQLLLWLDHVRRDISALSDLRSYDPRDQRGEVSPAFHGPEQRQRELDDFAAPAPLPDGPARVPVPPIDVLSFATLVRQPAGGGAIASVAHHAAVTAARLLDYVGPPVQLASRIFPGSEIARDLASGALSLGLFVRFGVEPESLFWHAHALCADKRLPFARPDGIAPGGVRLFEPGTPSFSSTLDLTERDNDGIVNTLSMLWPYDPARRAHPHYLLEADHADVLGHHESRAEPKPLPGGRRRAAYDIFQSGAGFTSARFQALWQQIFRFAL